MGKLSRLAETLSLSEIVGHYQAACHESIPQSEIIALKGLGD